MAHFWKEKKHWITITKCNLNAMECIFKCFISFLFLKEYIAIKLLSVMLLLSDR